MIIIIKVTLKYSQISFVAVQRSHEFQKCLTQQLLFCNGSRGSRKTCFEGQTTCACINSAMFDYKNYSHITLQLHPMGSFHFWYINCIYHHVSTTSISGPGTAPEYLLNLPILILNSTCSVMHEDIGAILRTHFYQIVIDCFPLVALIYHTMTSFI